MNVIHTKIYPRKLLDVHILSFNYNNGHNILRLTKSYQIFSFPTNEMEHDY